ncbi:MAG: CapA family protein [Prevotella sp.]|nr:CapA family protein [Prevotella sp.]
MKKIVHAFLLVMLVSCTVNEAQKNILAKTLLSEAVAATNDETLFCHGRQVNVNEEIISFAMCGDIMMGTTYPEVRLPANDGKYLFDDTKEITKRVDVAVGNLEGVLCNDGTSTKEDGPYSYSFMMPTRFASLLSDAGYDFLSMANNHANDFGIEGIASTEQCLDNEGIKYAGIVGRTNCAVIERRDRKIGFCAFGHNGYTYRHQDKELVKSLLDYLNTQCDIIVVSFHGGAEGKTQSHLPYGTEMFLNEDRGNLREFAHFCIDNGADVVYGHGPHVLRCIEVYNNRFIAYSLGNFCTPHGINITGISGYAPVIEIKIDKNDGSFKSGIIHSFIQQSGIGPRKDKTNCAAKEIKRLTIEDIVDSNIVIDNRGYISMQ